MPASAVFDLHCDTLTAFMDPTRCRDTLDDPLSSFALSKIPQGVSWCQCCAIFIPDGLTPKEARGLLRLPPAQFYPPDGLPVLPSPFLPHRRRYLSGLGLWKGGRLSSLWRMEQPWVDGWSA